MNIKKNIHHFNFTFRHINVGLSYDKHSQKEAALKLFLFICNFAKRTKLDFIQSNFLQAIFYLTFSSYFPCFFFWEQFLFFDHEL